MNVGVAIAIYISIFIIITILFILITRYFNYRLRKAINQGEAYQLIQGLKTDQEQITQSEYQLFLENNFPQISKNPKKVSLDQNLFDQTIENKDKIIPIQNAVYSSPAMVTPASSQSKRSIHTFRPDRLNTPQSTSSKSGLLAGNQKFFKSQLTCYFEYDSIMAAYSEDGLFIILKNVDEIWKESQKGEIKEKGTVQHFNIPLNDKKFRQSLQSYGFEQGEYAAYKFRVHVQIPNMKTNKIYQLDSLKTTTTARQQIEFHSFYHEYNEYEGGKQKQRVI